MLGDEPGADIRARVAQDRFDLCLEEVWECGCSRPLERADAHRHDAGRSLPTADWRPPGCVNAETGGSVEGSQQEDIVAVDHRRVGSLAVPGPDRAAVEGAQCVGTEGHVRKAANPDEAIRIVRVAERPEHADPDGLLRLHELALEELDQRLARAGVERVPPQLDDTRTPRLRTHPSTLALARPRLQARCCAGR